jgi:hypothetical protein
MDPKKDRGQNEPVQRMGIAKDLKRLKQDGQSSADELRDFIKGMHGKSPQEVLGTVSNSGLVQSTLLSAVGLLILMAAFTVGPYAWGKISPGDENTNQPKQQQTSAKEKSKTDEATQPAVATKENDKSDTTKTGQSNVKKAVGAMGIGETKTGEPNIDNLLDKKFDD